ncbi:hypothetical protein L1987_59145 [Smallanthus sonchifolius]|uniref:Uncharacterized protein n=1 Tax=Smallanthus sonchifolius TaxID=185202 RepID=A0ACB9D4R5_9ASTR|nr:hypothetical protein L1987_59145 [Smallanthus sonchifolius]
MKLCSAHLVDLVSTIHIADKESTDLCCLCVQQLAIVRFTTIDALKNQTVDLIFSAHPTESVCKSLLHKHGRIRDCLAQLYAKDISLDDKQELDEALHREIQIAFHTDEIRRTPPTPQDEMRFRMSYFHETIWKGVLKFLHRVDIALKNTGIDDRV